MGGREMTDARGSESMGAFEELMAELARPTRRTRARKKRIESAENTLPCGDLTCPCRVRPNEKISGSRCHGR
jgi:hypothetical protein